jgi:hypothetical protein
MKCLISQLCLLLLPFAATATQYRPWFGEDKVIEVRPSYTFFYYPHVDQGGDTITHESYNHLGALSISGQTDCTWFAEAEIHTAGNEIRGWSVEDYTFTGRYKFLNDCAGDPISMTVGVTVAKVETAGRKDFSTFHAGQMEYELHTSFGKEWICRQYWTSRAWGYLGGGIANRGSPWIRGILGYDLNHWNCYHYGIFAQGLFGFGQHDLCLQEPFRGYGAIKYRSIDISAYFTKVFGNYAELTLEYTLRPWAYNFPTHAHAVTVRFMWPYNL